MKRLLPPFLFILYSAALIKIMVFKDVPLIRVGEIMINFGGTQADRPPNFIPFKTIFPYLLGDKGLMIAGINLLGNVLLLVPLGFLLPFLFRNFGWKKTFVTAVASGLTIEILQVILRVGIFDLDDVILNALGVIVGYASSMIILKWIDERKYRNIFLFGIMVIAFTVIGYFVMFPPGMDQEIRRDNAAIREDAGPQGEDLCGGTGGNGAIVSVGERSFVMKNREGRNQEVKLTDGAIIHASHGQASVSDLKPGYRVTLVGGPNPDGTFTAESVYICNGDGPGGEKE